MGKNTTSVKRKKKKKKRDITKNPGLNKNLFSKVKQEYHDIADYNFELDVKNRQWLNSFMEEDLGANLNHGGKKIYKKKLDKLECFRRNNQRNRDLYSLMQVTKRLKKENNTKILLDEMQNLETTNPEDSILQLIDTKTEDVEILSLEEYQQLKNNLTEEVKRFYEEYYKLKKST